MQSSTGKSLAALSTIPFVMVLGNSMIIPVLPQIQKALNINEFQLGLIITLFSIPAGIIIPLAGFFSDHYGRKKVIIPSLIIYGIGGIVAGTSYWLLGKNSYGLLLGGRIIQGIGAAGTAPIAMALTGDLFTGQSRSRSLGIIETANGFGKVASPILGSLVGLIAWFATFLFFPVIVLPALLGIAFLVVEPDKELPTPDIKKYFKSIVNIFEEKASMLFASFLGGMVVLLLLFGVLFFLSDFLEKTYHLTGVIKGAALAIPVLFMCVSSFVTGTIIKRQITLMKWVVVSGLLLICLSLGLLGALQNTILFFSMISLAGVGTGMVLPCLNTLITSSVKSERRGLITSLYGSVRFFGVAAGPPIFGALMGIGRPTMFFSASGLAIITTIVALLFIRAKEIQKVSEQPEVTREMPAIIPEFVFEPAPARKPEPEK
ncbi:MAG: MFS transporter [Clostridiales bacterium]|nr:MFS transporter [Clostridiales bacterium]MCF8022757.1 MFS transporter [Clostridiales bacterium]